MLELITVGEARKIRYGTGHMSNGMLYKEGYCAESVSEPSGFFSHQCSSKIWKDCCCKQHHPETIASKDAKRDAKYQADKAARMAPYEKIKEVTTDLTTLLKMLVTPDANQEIQKTKEKLFRLAPEIGAKVLKLHVKYEDQK